MNKRGIVIAQRHTTLDGATRHVKLSGLELRKYLLFWDVIDYPYCPAITEETNDNLDLQFLESAKILKRTKLKDTKINLTHAPGAETIAGLHTSSVSYTPKGIVVRFSIPIELSLKAQMNAYIINDQLEPGAWTMAQIASEPRLYEEETVSRPGIEFELYNMLPVPEQDVPLNEIIEFKEKRKDELIEFRCHLDEIYQKIISSADFPRSRNTEITKLEKSISNLDNVLEAAGISRTTTSLRSYLAGDISSIMSAAGGTALLSSFVEMTPLINGAVSVGLYLAAKSLITPRKQPKGHPFLYLSSIRDHF